MEPSSLPAPPVGELVVLNGRQCGARRALTQPATFLGRAQGCDVRLNVEGVEAFHCVVVCRPGDVVLRDLNSTQGTFVNGGRVPAIRMKYFSTKARSCAFIHCGSRAHEGGSFGQRNA